MTRVLIGQARFALELSVTGFDIGLFGQPSYEAGDMALKRDAESLGVFECFLGKRTLLGRKLTGRGQFAFPPEDGPP